MLPCTADEVIQTLVNSLISRRSLGMKNEAFTIQVYKSV
jgi:hypothetical protein